MPNLSDKLKSLGVKVGARNLPPPVQHDAWPISRVMPGQVRTTPAGETYVVEASYPSPFKPRIQTDSLTNDTQGQTLLWRSSLHGLVNRASRPAPCRLSPFWTLKPLAWQEAPVPTHF